MIKKRIFDINSGDDDSTDDNQAPEIVEMPGYTPGLVPVVPDDHLIRRQQQAHDVLIREILGKKEEERWNKSN